MSETALSWMGSSLMIALLGSGGGELMHIVTGFVIVALSGTTVASCQESVSNPAGHVPDCARREGSTLKYDERINEIVKKTIEAGHSVLPNGIQVLTFVPIATPDSSEIIAMGACAVAPLTRILDWQSDFAQLISVRLLAQIGTEETTAALERALEPSRWQPVRMSALYGLTAASWNPQTRALVQRLTEDGNPRIRQIAQSILVEKLH